MLVSYPAIAIKLYQQSREQRRRVQQAPATATNPDQAMTEQQTRYHVKTLKIYVAVLALFIVSNVPSAILAKNPETQFSWLAYFFYFNNIGNPFIYYAFNKTFRDEVKAVWRSIVPCRP